MSQPEDRLPEDQKQAMATALLEKEFHKTLMVSRKRALVEKTLEAEAANMIERAKIYAMERGHYPEKWFKKNQQLLTDPQYVPRQGPANYDWTFSELVQNGNLDMKKYAKLNAEIYNLNTPQKLHDPRACWVDQREVIYLKEEDIRKGIKLGTDNLQQCIAVVVDGLDYEGKRMVALAHVDKNTSEASLRKVFAKFGNVQTLDTFEYGARHDKRDDTYLAVTEGNKRFVNTVADSVGVPGDRRRQFFGRENATETMVYDANASLESRINNETIPSMGHQTKLCRMAARRARDSELGNDYQSSSVGLRNADLVERDISKVSNEEGLVLTPGERKILTTRYSQDYNVILSQMDGLGQDPNHSFRQHIATSFIPFVDGTKKALIEMGHHDISEDHLYRKSRNTDRVDANLRPIIKPKTQLGEFAAVQQALESPQTVVVAETRNTTKVSVQAQAAGKKPPLPPKPEWLQKQ
jgi:hypothetical protein